MSGTGKADERDAITIERRARQAPRSGQVDEGQGILTEYQVLGKDGDLAGGPTPIATFHPRIADGGPSYPRSGSGRGTAT